VPVVETGNLDTAAVAGPVRPARRLAGTASPARTSTQPSDQQRTDVATSAAERPSTQEER
jgi:hypothetical protein